MSQRDIQFMVRRVDIESLRTDLNVSGLLHIQRCCTCSATIVRSSLTH